ICVLAGPGDRRDEDLREIARIAAKAFDFIFLRRDDDQRGRGHDDVPRLMAEELRAAGYPESQMRIIPDEEQAIDAALAVARRGVWPLISADKLSRGWKQVTYCKGAAGGAPAEPAPVALPVVEGPHFEQANVIQDERGVRLARESED